MKQKIKIMNHKQQPSDEEIQDYMNFDRLLESRKRALSASRRTAVLKWSIAVLTATIALTGLYFLKNDSAKIAQRQQPEDLAQPQSAAPLMPLDSVLIEGETSKVKGENAEIVQRQVPVTAAASGVDKQSEKSAGKKEPRTDVTESGYTQAEPISGYSDLYNYFNANLIYPSEALKDSVQGVQTISFIINKEGKPGQIEVEKSLGEAFEKEAKRLIEGMPAWKPAKLNGEPVPSKISIPITFQIQKIKN